MLGIIGPNGAGKTTLLEGISGLLPVDSGDVRWQGRSLSRALRRNATIGTLAQILDIRRERAIVRRAVNRL